MGARICHLRQYRMNPYLLFHTVLYAITLLGDLAVIPAAQIADEISRDAAQTIERNLRKAIGQFNFFSTYLHTDASAVGTSVKRPLFYF